MAFSIPPSLRDTSPIANATPRNATGHVRGEKEYIRYKQTDTMAFSIPPSLRDTSPIANATPRNATGHFE